MDKTFEIHDDEIDVNGILEKIRENVEKRYSVDYIDLLKKYEDTQKDKKNSSPSMASLEKALEYITVNHDISNNSYLISSHRPVTGKFLVKGRQLVNGEVRRYLDPTIFRQVEVNRHIADALRLEKEELYLVKDSIENELHSVKDNVNAAVLSLEVHSRSSDDQIQLLKEQVLFQQEQIASLRSENESIKKRFSDSITTNIQKEMAAQFDTLSDMVSREMQNRVWMLNVLEKNADQGQNSKVEQEDIKALNYLVFSEEMGKAWNRLSGRSLDESNIFNDSVQRFNNCKNVLDIGCGKGYLLQLLKESGISGYGIDTNEDYVLLCKRSGLDVKKDDALSYLRSLEDKTLDGIFISHLIEHLSPGDITELFKLCYSKLQYGSYLIVNTPNILSLIVSANLFYMDPTHKTHIHPEVIKFILRAYGFRDIEEKFYQPIPPETKLGHIELPAGQTSESLDSIANVCNANFDRLNDLMFGHRDYAVFAKK